MDVREREGHLGEGRFQAAGWELGASAVPAEAGGVVPRTAWFGTADAFVKGVEGHRDGSGVYGARGRLWPRDH